ncbi:hypothetical protein NitYY0826_C1460 [Nitratiruptor sp. YY08-26]|nr:hypothetical protein NitYY0813_C1458 [Nitratiruptor sp. YY08-13]BCD66518.1 hypothetical protein NitYY0826_C1460 [Nitratiruptor sp. YY08-26]
MRSPSGLLETIFKDYIKYSEPFNHFLNKIYTKNAKEG